MSSTHSHCCILECIYNCNNNYKYSKLQYSIYNINDNNNNEKHQQKQQHWNTNNNDEDNDINNNNENKYEENPADETMVINDNSMSSD